jgi:drug/metabolite transporter (DMT)-like permease
MSSLTMQANGRIQTAGLLLVLLATLCFSVAPIMIKVGLTSVDPITLVALRLLISAGVCWIVFPLVWPGIWRIDWRGMAICTAIAAANAASLVCYYLALTRIEASVASMIFSLYPLVAFLLLALTGNRIAKRDMVRLGIGLAGTYLVIGIGAPVDPVGVLLVLGTVIGYALHVALIEWYLHGYRSQQVVLYVISLMALMLTAVGMLRGRPWQPLDTIGWGAVLGTALVSTVAARLTLFAGLQRIGSGQTALFAPIETFLAVLWAYVFLGERLSPVQWVGGALILGSAALVTRQTRNSRWRS